MFSSDDALWSGASTSLGEHHLRMYSDQVPELAGLYGSFRGPAHGVEVKLYICTGFPEALTTDTMSDSSSIVPARGLSRNSGKPRPAQRSITLPLRSISGHTLIRSKFGLASASSRLSMYGTP